PTSTPPPFPYTTLFRSKPSNILITAEDTVRVADFGIARAANAQTITSQENVLASVPYGAPEHLTGQSLCEASDLYSVGVVLFERSEEHTSELQSPDHLV